ncbi:alanine racemase [Antribacter sp. KLBMP9083]|uniref:Alanine racemase n=1 Tax=Antribacter soli TaxID=2910976 RepID=A0AA41QBL9_9MICO|nr:alanine racemase [Antribacter soli]MCF4119795.1 alanine racemase [Antribacter soli]
MIHKGLAVPVVLDLGTTGPGIPGSGAAPGAVTARALVGRRVDDGAFSWPLLTLDEAALDHNIATVAGAIAACGAEHAPHVKTHMSRDLTERQLAAGAWGGTVATPAQLRTFLGWGLAGGGRRAILANELVDPREVAWLRGVLDRGEADEVWVYVDSARGVEMLARGFAGAGRSGLGVLVELGTPGGRTGVRTPAAAVALARAAADAGLRVLGVAGYEGPVASGTSAEELAAVAGWCAAVREAAAGVAPLVDGPVVLSAGGSAHADVVLRELTRPLAVAAGTRVVLRSGAYVTHDHGHYARADPWARLGATPLRPAITLWGQVLSAPEAGRVICGVGRRDVSFDIDLPVPLWVRPVSDAGRLGPARDLAPGGAQAGGARVTALNDQHAYLEVADGDATAPGDVVGFGISHPCTTLDKWRVAVLVRGDEVTGLVTLDF